MLGQNFLDDQSAARYESWAHAEILAETGERQTFYKKYICGHYHLGLCRVDDHDILLSCLRFAKYMGVCQKRLEANWQLNCLFCFKHNEANKVVFARCISGLLSRAYQMWNLYAKHAPGSTAVLVVVR